MKLMIPGGIELSSAKGLLVPVEGDDIGLVVSRRNEIDAAQFRRGELKERGERCEIA